MKKIILIVTLSFCHSFVLAEQDVSSNALNYSTNEEVLHSHGERSHSHNLPREGIKHKHGVLPIGSKASVEGGGDREAKDTEADSFVKYSFMSGYIKNEVDMKLMISFPYMLGQNPRVLKEQIDSECKDITKDVINKLGSDKEPYDKLFTKCREYYASLIYRRLGVILN
mgnify:CR=1 FL=1